MSCWLDVEVGRLAEKRMWKFHAVGPRGETEGGGIVKRTPVVGSITGLHAVNKRLKEEVKGELRCGDAMKALKRRGRRVCVPTWVARKRRARGRRKWSEAE
ncbi:hypothetical protein CBR_g50752 [Chara braunii]|uniref:Uncharacterized protein n=1 Tax=Chara braunii TaxID=69332 RepID=A0A388K5R4_CHABU|nr:hypothetical protein CBR_g50752 [Chara braunii]|eukprot:GBG65391.1 hypothetical protein CBR_g50752 [Chara braunii]